MTHLSGDLLCTGYEKTLHYASSVDDLERCLIVKLRNISKFMKRSGGTYFQINFQALVIDFCLKSDKMELLCDNQRGLQKTDHLNTYNIKIVYMDCL